MKESEDRELEEFDMVCHRIVLAVNGHKEYIAVSALMTIIGELRDKTGDVEIFDEALRASVDIVVGIE